MKLFAGVKGKVLAGTLSVGLLVGGTGAAASASGFSFTEYFKTATQSLLVTMSGWAGLNVQAHSEDKQAQLATKVGTEFKRAEDKIIEDIGWYAAQANGELDQKFNDLSTDITVAANNAITDAGIVIKGTVDGEVEVGKSNLENAAREKTRTLITEANERHKGALAYKKSVNKGASAVGPK